MLNNEYGITQTGFQRKTYYEILEELQDRAIEQFGEDINLSENSPLGQFLMVIAWEHSVLWEVFENSYYQGHLLYATGQNLDGLANNYWIDRKSGTYAKSRVRIYGKEGTRIKEGFKVAKGDLVYYTERDVVINKEGYADVNIEAEMHGIEYNAGIGSINTIVNPQIGVSKVENIELATGGNDVESDDVFRDRIIDKLRLPTTGDNANQYYEWAMEVDGIGSARVLRATPKAGYVTLIVAGTDGEPISDATHDVLYNHLDAVKPINAGVVIENAVSLDINIEVGLVFKNPSLSEQTTDEIISSVDEYLSMQGLNSSEVSYAKIGSIIFSHHNIMDYKRLKINDSMDNLTLENNEVPVLKAFEVV